jgi:hypothetical protein
MITIIVIAVAAALALLFLLKFVRSQESPIRNLDELVAQSEPVDLRAFRNLIDPQEESYLRANLSVPEFRGIQRARMRAALEYVRRTSHNAALLVRVGRMARNSPDPNTVRAAEQLANSAMELRIHSMLAVAYFRVRIVVPTVALGSSSFVDRYERLRDAMARLASLQTPAVVSRVDSAL